MDNFSNQPASKYVNCSGVNVPTHWAVDELQAALKARRIRFDNEEDIITTFQRYKLVSEEKRESLISTFDLEAVGITVATSVEKVLEDDKQAINFEERGKGEAERSLVRRRLSKPQSRGKAKHAKVKRRGRGKVKKAK